MYLVIINTSAKVGSKTLCTHRKLFILSRLLESYLYLRSKVNKVEVESTLIIALSIHKVPGSTFCAMNRISAYL